MDPPPNKSEIPEKTAQENQKYTFNGKNLQELAVLEIGLRSNILDLYDTKFNKELGDFDFAPQDESSGTVADERESLLRFHTKLADLNAPYEMFLREQIYFVKRAMYLADRGTDLICYMRRAQSIGSSKFQLRFGCPEEDEHSKNKSEEDDKKSVFLLQKRILTELGDPRKLREIICLIEGIEDNNWTTDMELDVRDLIQEAERRIDLLIQMEINRRNGFQALSARVQSVLTGTKVRSQLSGSKSKDKDKGKGIAEEFLQTEKMKQKLKNLLGIKATNEAEIAKLEIELKKMEQKQHYKGG